MVVTPGSPGAAEEEPGVPGGTGTGVVGKNATVSGPEAASAHNAPPPAIRTIAATAPTTTATLPCVSLVGKRMAVDFGGQPSADQRPPPAGS